MRAPGHRARTGAGRGQQQHGATQQHREDDQRRPEHRGGPLQSGLAGQRGGHHRERTGRQRPGQQRGQHREHPGIPREETGPKAVRDRCDMVQRLVGGEHHTRPGQQQTDQAGNEWNCRRRQGGQRVLDRGSQRLRHDLLDQPLTQVRMIGQHPGQYGHPEQQQREDAQESVVGDQRRLPAAVIVAVLLHHRVGEPQHTMRALQPVRPRDDPVRQATQTFQAHRPSLPGTTLAGQLPVLTDLPR